MFWSSACITGAGEPVAIEKEIADENQLTVVHNVCNIISARLREHEQVICDRLDSLELLVKESHGRPSRCNEASPSWLNARKPPSVTFGQVLSDTPASHDSGLKDIWNDPTPASTGSGHIRVSQSDDLQHAKSFDHILSLFSSAHHKNPKKMPRCQKWPAEYLPPIGRHRWAARALYSWQFNCIVSLTIVANSVIIGLQTNYDAGEVMSLARGRPSSALAVTFPLWLNHVFAIFFVVELLFRLYVERGEFGGGANGRWNLFDLFLVLSTVFEMIMETRNLTFARALRLLRIVHVLQVIRVFKVFDVLRYMLFSILNSMVSVLWVVLLMGLLLYVYGNFVLAVVAQHVEDCFKGDCPGIPEAERDEHIATLHEMFGTISRCILYLFASVTGGINWIVAFQALVRMHWGHGLTFLLFFVFIALGVLNIVTGIFVERATELTAFDKEVMTMSKLDNMNRLVQNLQDFFNETDADKDGFVTWEEFRKKLRNRDVIAYLQTLGIDVHDALRVFQLLDRRGHGVVEIRDFVEGCIHLKGQAQSMDICMLLQDVRRMGNMLEVFMHYTEDQFVTMRGQTATDPHSIGARLRSLVEKRSSNRSFHHIQTEFNWHSARSEQMGYGGDCKAAPPPPEPLDQVLEEKSSGEGRERSATLG